MGRIDIWSLMTGFVGILSFFLAVWDRFPKAKTYLIWLALFFGGFTFGRLTPLIDSGLGSMVNNEQISSNMIVLILLVGVAVIYFLLMIKRDSRLALSGLFIILFAITPYIMKTYSDSTFRIPSSDYLKLAVIYEEKQDFNGAIWYLNKYYAQTSDTNERKLIQEKISELKQEQLESAFSDKK